ncbi:MAG: pyruvate carboxyltransferase, partial [Tissierellia bacterium]|nr:pyruvate carboxyltransferase [Tissierellia bacterium]
MSKKYKTDKWYTSPWNFLEEISNQFNFAENIRLHDVSLRDGEQQAGLIFNKEQKIEIADRLMEIGVHRIEAGMPAVSKQDEAAIREIVKRSENTNTEVFAFARCMKEDVKLAADCGVKGIVVEIPSSEHIIQNAYNWPLKRAVEASIEATKLAKELGLYTVFFPIDMTRADIDWVLDLVEDVATNGHMDALALVDTFGGISPHAVPYLVRKAKQRINKPMEAHFHDDFGLGTANTIMALAAGVEVAHTTIMGIGERAGNVSFEELALSLLTMYDVNLGLKTEKLYELDKFVKDISGLKMKQNKGIFGENIFDIESGIVTGWYVNARKNHPLELSPYL